MENEGDIFHEDPNKGCALVILVIVIIVIMFLISQYFEI